MLTRLVRLISTKIEEQLIGSQFCIRCIVAIFLNYKTVINFASFGILLLIAQELPKLGAVLRTTCNMKTFEFLAMFKRLLLLILLSLAHAGKGKGIFVVI